jgi:hypothetical protein
MKQKRLSAFSQLIYIWKVNTDCYDSTPSPSPTTLDTAASNTIPTVSTIYYAPVTITPSSNCLTHTSYSYVTMRPLTGTLAQKLASATALNSLQPWSTTTIPGSAPSNIPSSALAPSQTFLQVDIFLSQQPFSIGPNGEESAWAKACYDPRDTPCPTNAPVMGPAGAASCLSNFPGLVVATTSAVPTVWGPNGAAGAVREAGRTAVWVEGMILGILGAFWLV